MGASFAATGSTMLQGSSLGVVGDETAVPRLVAVALPDAAVGVALAVLAVAVALPDTTVGVALPETTVGVALPTGVGAAGGPRRQNPPATLKPDTLATPTEC